MTFEDTLRFRKRVSGTSGALMRASREEDDQEGDRCAEQAERLG